MNDAPQFSQQELTNAVMNECTCGGGGPDDKHTCPACQVYHRLVTKATMSEPMTPKSEPLGAVASTGLLGGIWRKLWGEPIWTQDHDGEVRKSRMQRICAGKVRVKKVMGWVVANADGTVPHGYVEKWWPR